MANTVTVAELKDILATVKVPDHAEIYTGWSGDSATLKVAWEDCADGIVLCEIETGQ